MNPAGLTTLATFAAALPLLLVAHNLADHITGQTHKQATEPLSSVLLHATGGAQ